MEISLKKLSVPIMLMQYAFEHNLIKELTIYLFLKMYSSGKVNRDSKEFAQLRTLPNLSDKRTINKHMEGLIRLNWVGYNPLSGNYFIRSFDRLRKQYGFDKRQAAVFYSKDFLTAESFFAGAMISKEINVQKFLRVKRKGKYLAVTNKSDVTMQPNTPPFNYPYNHFGLSNGILAKMFHCSQTWACHLKHKAVEDGYIKTAHKFLDVAVIDKPDYNVRDILSDLPKGRGNRIKFIPQKNSQIKVVEQMYDEIIPLVKIKSLKKFSMIKKAA